MNRHMRLQRTFESAPSVCTDGEDLQEACRKETARLEKEKNKIELTTFL